MLDLSLKVFSPTPLCVCVCDDPASVSPASAKVGFLTLNLRRRERGRERWGREKRGRRGGYVEEKELCVFGRGGW